MAIHDFKYPIMPDRLYTITYGEEKYEVMGDILITLYRLYGDLSDDLNTLTIRDTEDT